MKVDSALELQGEIFSKLFKFEEMASAAADHGEGAIPTYVDPRLIEPKTGAAASAPTLGPKNRIALGVGAGPDFLPDSLSGAKLAVLVQNKALLNSNLVDDIKSIAKNEAEIIYIGRQQAFWTQNRNQPLRMGCSTSPQGVNYSGTLGAFAKDAQTGKLGFLSNNHVLADVNALSPGFPIIQQGASDGGHPTNDIVGTLSRYIHIHLGGVQPNTVDAAFAILNDQGHAIDCVNIYDSNTPPVAALAFSPANVAVAQLGGTVYKTGRTTRHTLGRVVAINVNNYTVSMGGGRTARFDGQITFDAGPSGAAAFSRPGDSGSIIVDANGAPIALLFAGSRTGGARNLGVTSGNPISSVLSQLKITLV